MCVCVGFSRVKVQQNLDYSIQQGCVVGGGCCLLEDSPIKWLREIRRPIYIQYLGFSSLCVNEEGGPFYPANA